MAFYDFARAVTGAWCYGPLRMRVIGIENVPHEGPLIVACNHVSYVDPVALGVALPRRVWYMAKAELFHIPVLGPTIAALGAYPVDRGKGDVAAIRGSVRVLKEGKAIGIFPEGTRNLTEMLPFIRVWPCSPPSPTRRFCRRSFVVGIVPSGLESSALRSENL